MFDCFCEFLFVAAPDGRQQLGIKTGAGAEGIEIAKIGAATPKQVAKVVLSIEIITSFETGTSVTSCHGINPHHCLWNAGAAAPAWDH